MSTNGRIHFQEVKTIFEVIQVLMISSGVVSFIMTLKRLREKRVSLF